MLTLISVGLFISLMGCPDKHNNDTSEPESKVIYVRGDPHEMVAGAKMNSTSPITENNAAEWSHFSLMTMYQFPEREAKISTKNIKSENATQTRKGGLGSEKAAVKVEPNSAGEWQMTLLGGKITLGLELDSNARLQPKSVTSSSGTFPITPMHWSTSADGNYVSFLLSMNDPDDGQELVALYFQKAGADQPVPMTDSQYIYLTGPGQKLAWKVTKGSELDVHLCGAPAFDGADNAILKWNEALNGRLKIKFTQVENFAPFSDLNEHCIYTINAYLADGREDIANYGATVTIKSFVRTELADADVFLFRSEFAKINTYAAKHGAPDSFATKENVKHARLTYIHELGHLLGLGHKFDGTLSIMSYDWNTDAPTAYDTAAVHELYPLLN